MTAPEHAKPPRAPWVPSRKVLTTVATNVLTWGVALLVARLGLHEDSLTAGMVTAVIGIVAGGIAGYLVKEIPRIEADVDPVPKGG